MMESNHCDVTTTTHVYISHMTTATILTMASNIAGRTNYGKWDKIASELVEETEEQEEREAKAAAEVLGHTRSVHSQAEKDEKAKAEKVQKTKEMLDAYKKREDGIVQTLKDLIPSEELSPATKFVTRDLFEAGKRVLTIADTSGPGKVVLTQDLSNLECAFPANDRVQPKSYVNDAENDVLEESKEERVHTRRVYGLIKLHLHNLRRLTVIIRCKIITSTIEISNCEDLIVKVEGPDAAAATVQADLCQNLTLEYHDAPSGKNHATGLPVQSVGATAVTAAAPKIYWGEDSNDRVLHAGVNNLTVKIYRDGFVESETKADYEELGAKSIGNAPPEEMQFVTSVVSGELKTEKVFRNGSGSAHGGSRVMTEREVEEERKRKEDSPCPENLIRFVDVNGKKSTDKAETPSPTSIVRSDEQLSKTLPTDDVVEEIYLSMSKDAIDAIVRDCELQKAEANETFATGEYAQAVLLYSLVLDRCADLPDAAEARKVMDHANKDTVDFKPPSMQLYPRHVILSNRSAAFLKLGEHEKALKDATQAVALDPSYVKAVFRKGLALHAMGRYQEAVPALGAAHCIEPKNKQIKQALQFAEVRMQQEMRKRLDG